MTKISGNDNIALYFSLLYLKRSMFDVRVWYTDKSKTELSIFGETTCFDNLIT